MRSSPVGYHLWEVELLNASGQALWITTRTNDEVLAMEKTIKTIKAFRKSEALPKAKFHSIKNRGTIDA